MRKSNINRSAQIEWQLAVYLSSGLYELHDFLKEMHLTVISESKQL